MKGYLKAGFAIVLLVFCVLCFIASLQQIPTAIGHWRQNDKSGAITTWVILIVAAWGMNASLALDQTPLEGKGLNVGALKEFPQHERISTTRMNFDDRECLIS